MKSLDPDSRMPWWNPSRWFGTKPLPPVIIPAVRPVMPSSRKRKRELQFFVTLSPSMAHFRTFATEDRLAGIRINSAQMFTDELDNEIAAAAAVKNAVPLWFDIKGKQLRIDKPFNCGDHLEMTINHPIQVDTPVVVWFKAEKDAAKLVEVTEGGYRLVFEGGPKYMVKEGESFHILDKSLRVGGDTFTAKEKDKIRKVSAAGFSRYCLSYVQSQRDVDEFRDLVGRDAKVILKIEDEKGLKFIADEWQPQPGIHLMAARGDLFVELSPPHRILDALKLIVAKDPGAWVGSRILLSLCRPVVIQGKVQHEGGQICYEPVPDCADLCELAWLYDIGYRRMLLCDELCMKEEWLRKCINILDAFRRSYTRA